MCFELSISPMMAFYNVLNLSLWESSGSHVAKVGRFVGCAYESGIKTLAAHLFVCIKYCKTQRFQTAHFTVCRVLQLILNAPSGRVASAESKRGNLMNGSVAVRGWFCIVLKRSRQRNAHVGPALVGNWADLSGGPGF